MVTLGMDKRSGQAVALSPEGRRQSTYVLGINGTGKSNLLLDIALQDIANGDGLCLMDPHGDLIEDVLERVPPARVPDVIVFDPADIEFPFGLNMFELEDVSNPLLVDRVCSEIVTTLKKMFGSSWGPRLEDLLRHCVLTLMATPNRSMLDMLPLLTDYEWRQEYVARTNDPVLLHYWRETFPPPKQGSRGNTAADWVAPVLNKIGRFLTNPVIRNIVAQPKSSFDFRKVMDDGKILLVNLSKGQLGDENSSLLGTVLVGKLLIAALSRSDIDADDRRPFHLIVDEYHSFATDSFPTLQSEARKFGIDTIVAHQYRHQLDPLNFGSTLNVGNFIIFRTTGIDAKDLALQFDNCPPEAERVLRAMPKRTGRPDVYRTTSDQVYVAGNPRSYTDVEHETANQMANNPNYHAFCKFIVEGTLTESYIQTRRVPEGRGRTWAKALKANSRAYGTPRAEVEGRFAEFWERSHRTSRSYTMD